MTMQDPTTPESGYETTDVTLRPVTIAIAFICGLLVVSMILMRALLGTLGARWRRKLDSRRA